MIDAQIDLFAGPPKPALILELPEVKEWVEERIAIMVHDGHQDEAESRIYARGRAVKLFRSGYFGI